MLCAIYSGSFNPVHYGHLSIARYLIEQCNVDQVRFVLSPKNPLKDADTLSDAQMRLTRLREAIDDMGEIKNKIAVSDVEFHLPTPLYSINTLRFIRDSEPQHRFVFIIGADNIEIIEKWHEWKSLLMEFEIWVYPRPGYANAEAKCRYYSSLPEAKGVKFLADAPLYNISSTEIRKAR